MRVHRVLSTLSLALLLAAPSIAVAQPPQGAGATPAGGAAKAGKEADLLPAEPVVSQHSGRFNGQTVPYTTEAGWLPIRDDGKVVAKMFYVAYTKNGITDTSTRPLIMSFNGGPGTASLWMHLGYTGPLTIEREYSPDQAGDVEAALRLLERQRAKILS